MGCDLDVGERVRNRQRLLNVSRMGSIRGQRGELGCDQCDLNGLRCVRDEDFGFPGDDIAAGVDRGAIVEQCGRPLGIPAVLVRAHPLHPHRTARRFGDERGIGCCVLVSVAPVASRAVDVDAAYVLGRHAEHLRELLAQQMGCLRSRPAGEFAVVPLRHRTGWTDRAVGMDGEVVGCAQFLRCGLARVRAVADGLQHVAVIDLGRADVIPQLGLIGQTIPLRPFRFHCTAGPNRRPLGLRHHRKKIALPTVWTKPLICFAALSS